jgi:hypothetical protein
MSLIRHNKPRTENRESRIENREPRTENACVVLLFCDPVTLLREQKDPPSLLFKALIHFERRTDVFSLEDRRTKNEWMSDDGEPARSSFISLGANGQSSEFMNGLFRACECRIIWKYLMN